MKPFKHYLEIANDPEEIEKTDKESSARKAEERFDQKQKDDLKSDEGKWPKNVLDKLDKFENGGIIRTLLGKILDGFGDAETIEKLKSEVSPVISGYAKELMSVSNRPSSIKAQARILVSLVNQIKAVLDRK